MPASKPRTCGWDEDRRQDCRDWRPWAELAGGFDCGCTTRCLYPSKKAVSAARQKNIALLIIGRKIVGLSPGTSFSWHADGTQIHKEHDLRKPTRVTTTMPDGRITVSYEGDHPRTPKRARHPGKSARQTRRKT